MVNNNMVFFKKLLKMKNCLSSLCIACCVLCALFSSCSTAPCSEEQDELLVASDLYLMKLNNLTSEFVKSSSEEDNDVLLDGIISSSIDFLDQNDLDYSVFDNGDPRIAIVALAVLESELYLKYNTKGTVIGDCVLEAFGLKGIFEGVAEGLTKALAKKVAKVAAKQLLEKSVPYVGWGIVAVDFTICMVNNN